MKTPSHCYYHFPCNDGFAATYQDMPGQMRKWNLRSEDSRMDVSEICRQLGGGGHRNAAGFEEAL